MHTITRGIILWFYIIATVVTFLGVISIVTFEVHIRWVLNQNFALLDGSGLSALIILFGIQMIGLVWLSRSH